MAGIIVNKPIGPAPKIVTVSPNRTSPSLINCLNCEPSTLDWTTPMREVIVKSKKVGDFL